MKKGIDKLRIEDEARRMKTMLSNTPATKEGVKMKSKVLKLSLMRSVIYNLVSPLQLLEIC